ncbi:MAG: hypothetical protein JWN76_2042, partial [Chitinophagaceae bacterium]|nr:hypothetical protein [Chitinophagaceae bacterium]
IMYPFSEKPFLLGDNTVGYIATAISAFLLYAIFCWLLAMVFKTFLLKKLFTPENAAVLRRFYLFNFILPVLLLAINLLANKSFARYSLSDFIMIIFLHWVIGIFAFFMATIFKQGVRLQNEQDFTI